MKDEDNFDAGFIYCPYVPLQYHSVHGFGMIGLGVFYGNTSYPNVHSLWNAVFRKELKTMKNFVIDMLL